LDRFDYDRRNRNADAMELRALTCSNCTAPLGGADLGNDVIACSYCGHAHRFAKPPPPPAEHRHPVGSEVVVHWGSQWWDAHVIATPGPEQWLIRYDGWSESWDETVGPSRIRDRHARHDAPRLSKRERRARAEQQRQGAAMWKKRRVSGTELLIGVGVFIALSFGVFYAIGWTNGSSVRGAEANDAIAEQPEIVMDGLHMGQRVEVEWNGSWYRSQIIGLLPDGRVRIHYFGWSSSSDEDVPRSRVRLPTE
jgi:DNA-directed RNA polymerase subunit RPC12/RpoP